MNETDREETLLRAMVEEENPFTEKSLRMKTLSSSMKDPCI